jgi:hypothetical protein
MIGRPKQNLMDPPADFVAYKPLVWLLVTVMAMSSPSLIRPVGAQDLSPEHATVKTMVSNGVRYLSLQPYEADAERFGYEFLKSYTILKATEDDTHPIVSRGAKLAENYVKGLKAKKSGSGFGETLMYDASLAAIFLAALNPDQYRTELETIRDFLLSTQKQTGGFGYLHAHQGSQGDTSQTQYVTLALWSMKQVRIEIDRNAVERLTQWIMRSQKDGAWTYQIGISEEPSHSMVAAGLSAALIGVDILGSLRMQGSATSDDDSEDALPAAFRQVLKLTPEDKARGVGSDSKALRQKALEVASRTNQWLSKNKYNRSENPWHYYWMYSNERFQAFLELASGKRNASPEWYNRGVMELKAEQNKDGSWDKFPDISGPETATCFAILFLLRSTQKSIGDIKSADSVGGFGLANVAEVGMVDGKLIDKAKVTSIEDALSMLEESAPNASNDKLLAERLTLDPDPKRKKDQLNRFSRMLRSPDARARRIAAKMIGRGDDLDFAPDLIYALSEGERDNQVLRLAESSLRILSRQLDTRKLPAEGTITIKDRLIAEQYWKAWYLSIRPDHVFVIE